MTSPQPHSNARDGVAAADRARAELYDTLGQLRERLDYAQRIDDAVDRASRRIAETKRENPLGFAVGVAVAAIAVGGAVWGVSRLISRAFRS